MLRFRSAILLVLAAASPSAASSQEFALGRHIPGVRLAVGFDPYDITGSTAIQIARQLEIAGRPSVTRYPALFSWTYDAEVIPRVSGMPSDQCRFTDFEITLDFTAVFPRWRPPEDADPTLVRAWQAFGEDIEAQWARERDEYLTRARELVRRADDYEDHCPLLLQRFHNVVLEYMDRSRSIEDHSAPEYLGLQWPPEGYEELLTVRTAQETRVVPEEGVTAADDQGPSTEPGGGGEGLTEGGDVAPRARTTTVSVRPGRPRPSREPAADLDFALQTDLRGSTPTGLVAGLYHQGTLQYLNAVGTDAGSEQPLTVDTPLGIPAFTEILVSTLAVALDKANVLNLDAPVSTYLDGLSPRLGQVTTRQLIEHRAGLDNAPPRDTTMTWSEAVDRLDDRALFTAPGTVPSYSSYSFGLAAKVIEATTGSRLEDVLLGSLIGPLGMVNTHLGPRDEEGVVGGLPVAYVSGADMMRFWLAWLGGSISGAGSDVLPDGSAFTLSPDGRAFRGGLWLDRPAAVPRLSVMCGSQLADVAVQVFPLTNTVLVVMGTNGWPSHTATFMLDAVGRSLGIDDEIFAPVRLRGIAGFGRRGRTCSTLSTSRPHVPVDFGPRAETGDWAGRYLSGDWFFALEDAAGVLVSPRPQGEPWLVHHFEGDTYFAALPEAEGQGVGFPLRLFRSPDGRRYLMLEDRAYLHEDDRPTGRHP